MATSNLQTILDALETEIAKSTYVKTVDTRPMSADDWVRDFINAGDNRIPAVHIGVGPQKVTTESTDGDLLGELPVTLTFLINVHGDQQATMVTVAEDVWGQILDDLTLGGYAEYAHLAAGPEVEEEHAEITRFKVELEVVHVWTM